MNSDVSLTEDLAQARKGDDAAFSRIYRAVQPGLVRYLTSLVGADADDVASETWAQACRDLGKFKGDIDGFRGWIARIGRNRAIDLVRSQQRRPTNDAPVEELHGLLATDDTEGSALEGFSTKAAIAAIAALPKDQAEAVMLRAVMGLDAASAAKVLGKRAGAVRTAAFRGLKSLERDLQCLSPRSTTHRDVTGTESNVFDALDADGMR